MLISKAISDGILQPNDKLPFHKLVRFVSEYFTYDVENSVFFAKNGDKTKAIYLMDIIEQLSIIGIELSPEKLAQATESSKVQKEATLEHLVASLPEWDGIDHIKKFVEIGRAHI